ncbi:MULTISPECIES: hypothetical protein [unclassified Coleofasciculus]|uniref:hypothetical protein n=1 Tax=unclassified Coleofasciculus TaxID=2692782 RepID=UPI001880B193|nr:MULTISPECIES: hypothetical protein [unclassified Coleofasciculus]MBE9128349.1 hypothetical protein [Coleofasciculus sp. LEGE 07081]MBE9151405.1 hypothetical protein [Coleofasciculus sp. LEGE 07092]
MKLRLIALATVCTLPLSLSLSFAAEADEPNQPCQAYLDTSNGTDAEENNCPITVGKFSIRGTFSNSNWQASFWAWEPASYILYVKNQQDGNTINLTGFNVIGTTSRPQYQFTDSDRGLTYVVTFRYSDTKSWGGDAYADDKDD